MRLRDISGPPECQLCDRSYPVSSLARDCERRHLEQEDDDGE